MRIASHGMRSTLQPNAVDPIAGHLRCGAEEPRQHWRRAWIRARLPAVSRVIWLTSELNQQWQAGIIPVQLILLGGVQGVAGRRSFLRLPYDNEPPVHDRRGGGRRPVWG